MLKNSLVVPRDGEVSLFRLVANGVEIVGDLNGYALVPREDYELLAGTHLHGPSFPCRKCGASGPDEKGHDPCIASLPGVQFACCGHGRHEGCAMFDDGRVIRGRFERTKRG